MMEERVISMKTLYYNGKIYTGTLPLVSCFVVEDGRFCFAGNETDAPLAEERIDLQGKFCSECGAKKPAAAPLYRCDKCGWEPEDPRNPPQILP